MKRNLALLASFDFVDLAFTDLFEGAALDAAAPPEPPREARLFRAGKNVTRKGTFVFDADAAKSVLAAAADWGIRFPFDYNHSMLGAQHASDPAKAGESAGTFALAVRDGALWAVDIEWNADGAARVRGRTYRYLSPAFRHDANGRIVEIVNCALTNLPASKHLDPLMLSLSGGITEVRMKGILVALGLAETAGEGEAVASATTLRGDVAELLSVTGAQTARAALGTVRALQAAKAEHEKQVAALGAEVTRLQAGESAREIDDATKAGKLTPAQRTWAEQYAAKDHEGFLSYLAAAPVIQKLDAKAGEKSATASGTKTETLSAEEIAVCKQIGVDPKDFAAQNAARGN